MKEKQEYNYLPFISENEYNNRRLKAIESIDRSLNILVEVVYCAARDSQVREDMEKRHGYSPSEKNRDPKERSPNTLAWLDNTIDDLLLYGPALRNGAKE